jgi:hypothetical protein
MENLDIIILTSILSTLFIVFGIVVVRELSKPESELQSSKEGGPRADFIRFVGTLFDEEATKKMSKKEKRAMYGAIKRTMADMESDGVYFSPEDKKALEQKRKEMTCEYSGLPSVKAYVNENFFNGHS